MKKQLVLLLLQKIAFQNCRTRAAFLTKRRNKALGHTNFISCFMNPAVLLQKRVQNERNLKLERVSYTQRYEFPGWINKNVF